MIYLVRHGETVWNTQNRRQGWLDSPLTVKGLSQASRNGKRLRQRIGADAPVAILSSPLARAWQTATILAEELGQDPHRILLEPTLKECSFGKWDGLTAEEIKDQFPENWAARETDRWNIAPEGGESYADVEARLLAWYGARALPKPVILVCHGLTSRVLRGLYAGLTTDEMFALPETQDGFFELKDGQITVIAD